MSALREHWQLYWRLVGAQVRSQMQYKVGFLLSTLSSFGAYLSELAALLVLYQRIPHLAGWTVGEVAMLWGLTAISFALAELFSDGFDHLPSQIRLGTFDRVLTRPLGAFFQVLASELNLRRAARVTQGVVALLVAQQTLAIAWSADKLLVLALAVAGGAGIFYSIYVLGAAYYFWTIEGQEVVNTFTYGGATMASYPLDIFHGWIRRFVTFVVPVAFVNYYPLLYILGRPDPLGLPSWAGFLSPLVAAAFGTVAGLAWSAGVRHYQSTGS
jgi:ABC-2 type transport system permease protein